MDVRAREESRSDAELVAAAMAGDRGAFAAICDRYADRLHDFCWSLLRGRDERIWNRTSQPVLRLITCGGSFDRSTGHYRDNVIVYARPAP
jgi:hypothetical protein